MTYLSVNAVVLVLAVLVAAALLRRRPSRGRIIALMAVTLVVVAVFTAVFDSLMIAAGLFTYAESRIVGLRIGLAPIEDFAYVALAAVLLPALWLGLPRRNRPGDQGATGVDDATGPENARGARR